MEEIWKDIPGYEGRYQVSNMGRVKSLPRVTHQKFPSGSVYAYRRTGKILKPRPKACGHTQVQLGSDGNFLIHRLVMLAFVGPCPEGKEVCHNDNNPSNNCLSNLRYDTRHSNRVDLIFEGHQGRQKLSVTDVREIRERLSRGERVSALAKEYHVCHSTIWNIKRGVTFKCV